MSELRPEARALVEAARAAFLPTAEDRARNLAALGSRLDLSGPGHAHQPMPAAANAGGLGWPALSAVAVGLALSGGLAYVALRAPRTNEPKVAPAAVASAPVVAASTVQTSAEPVEAPPTAAPVVSEARTVAARPRASDRLAEEVAILSRAEKDLHAGRYAAALGALDEHARKFPRGVLTQERIAARVQALCGLGRAKEAEADLRRLAPGSLQGARARETCAASAKH